MNIGENQLLPFRFGNFWIETAAGYQIRQAQIKFTLGFRAHRVRKKKGTAESYASEFSRFF
jgi:hypothetical protein